MVLNNGPIIRAPSPWFNNGSQYQPQVAQDVIILDGSGLIIGHTAQVTNLNGPAKLQNLGTGSDDSSIAVGRWSGAATAGSFDFIKSRNGTIGSNTKVEDNDPVGAFRWLPDDGVVFQTLAASFEAEVDDASPEAGDIGMAFVWEQMPGGGGGIAETMRLAANGTLFVGDNANGNMTTGLTINQGASTDAILEGKSSSITHGLVSNGFTAIETDSYFQFRKRSALVGGLVIAAVMDDTALDGVLTFYAQGGTATTTKTTAGVGLIDFLAMEHNGANARADITADGNVFSVRARVGSANATRFLIDEDGDMYSVVAGQTFDGYDDAAMLRAFDRNLNAKETIRTEFDSFVQYEEQNLIDAGILGAPVSEGGMWNVTQHSRWLTGAAWQIVEDVMSIVQVLSDEQRQQLTPRLQNRLAMIGAQ